MRTERRVIRMFVVCALVLFAAGVTSRTARAANPIESNQNPPDLDDLRAQYTRARELSAGIDPGLTALRDCNHYVKNASGAPWTVDQSARECHARESSVKDSIRCGRVIDSPEIQDVLVNSYAWGGVRKSSLYTTQELFDHARGMPVRMDMNRIGGVLTESGPGAQGLVFVRTPAANATNGETVGHVFNAFNDNGTVRFIDEQPAGGAMDARFWFSQATEVWFYEVLQ